ncbi:WSC domain-containing protein [Fusarium acuminatum]
MIRLYIVTISLLFLFIPVVSQQTPDSNGENPSIYRASGQYRYHGCYNETTQTPDSAEERALTGGSHLVEAGKMTVPLCLEFCASNGTQYQYAGLEWSRECWCSPYLSSLSTKLDDDECKNSCEGNSSQVCGGPLKLSVYELSKGGDTPDRAAMLQIPCGMAVLSVLSGLFLWQ